MKKNLKSLMFLLFACCVSTTAYSGYDAQCLNDCFSTGHECNYCNYQCYSEDAYQSRPRYSDAIPCPLQGYTYQDQ